jgi:hypothetical protein
MTRDQKALITKISKKYGATIDLDTHPEVLIDILRAFGRIFEDDGGAPGGVGHPGCIGRWSDDRRFDEGNPQAHP